jgi:hypothetical protein
MNQPINRQTNEWTNQLTNQPIPRGRDLSEKLTGPQLVKKFPAVYGTQRFINTSKSTCHLSLPSARNRSVDDDDDDDDDDGGRAFV